MDGFWGNSASKKRHFENVSGDNVSLMMFKKRRDTTQQIFRRNVLVDEIVNEGGVDKLDVEEGEIVEVDSADLFLEGHREYGQQVNAQMSEDGVENGTVDRLDVEEGEIVEVEDGVHYGLDDKQDIEEGEIVEVDSANRFPECSGQYSPKVNASEESVVIRLDYEMKVKAKSALVEVDSAMQFQEGFGRVAKLSGEGVTVGSDYEMNVKVENAFVESDCAKQFPEAGQEYSPQLNAELCDKGVGDSSVDQFDIEEGEILEVDSANGFTGGFGQNSPKVNVSEESCSGGSDYEMKVKIDSALLKVDSAKQFPEAFGQLARQVDAILSREGGTVGSVFKPDSAQQSGRLIRSEVLEVARSLVSDESLQSPNTSTSETVMSLKFLDQMGEREASELKKAVELMVNHSGNYEPKYLGLSNNLNDTYFPGSKRDSTVYASKGYLNNIDHPEGKGLPSCFGLQLPVDSVLPDAFVQIDDSDRPQASFPPENVEQSLHREYPRQSRSARRDFPAGCGRRALLNPVDEYQELVECYQDRSVGEKSSGKSRLDQFDSQPKQKDFAKISFKRLHENTLSPSYAKSSYFSNNDEKMRMKPANLSNMNSIRRNVFGKSVCERCAVNKPKGKEIVKTPIFRTHETMKSIAEKCEFEAQKTSKVIIRKRNNEVIDYLSEHDDSALIQRSRNMASSSTAFNWGVTDKSNQADLARIKVGETLRLFQMVFRKLMHGVEAKPKVKNGPRQRIDLVSATLLREKNKCVNTGKILGRVPGVEVGDEFHYRVELAIIGLHHHYQNGIEYMQRDGKIVATSIVSSGGYDDYMDSSDVLVYSGQGGTPEFGDKMPADQMLIRGNLALTNSMVEGTPVRVIRGFKGNDSLDARMNKAGTLVYDGLYLVKSYWKRQGCYGNQVFMFRLRRIVGQPELAIKELKKSKRTREREGCAKDISQGKEKMPIGAVNRIDAEKPPKFKYIRHVIHPLHYDPIPPRGCDCIDGCLSSTKCLCTIRNGGQIPFNYNGALVETKPLVYECGPRCKCPPSCYNRVSQHGIKFQLELFKTESRGWGVRSLISISSGSFICDDHAVSTELSKLMPSDLNSNSSCEDEEDVSGFTIDAAQYGNVGRFINHSCSPNLYAQNVLYDNDDKRMPHIMLFAAENIPPLQELTYHYKIQLDQVYDSNGNIKKKNCYCGSLGCRGRIY
ncbi:hypothetical protein IFM89_032067 [Coptis chinensis]|uniref:Uncharacterized protein n=1 Tax=Coptis chinensis TaxID=261450 RepID=A0A835I8T7_9MAGN|nr:hypothetical protein IFM89_032067 [Coptis chinensis]